jgi:hypothetical protein
VIVRRGRGLGVATVLAACALGAVALSGCGAANVVDPVAQAATVSNQVPGLKMSVQMRLSSPALPSAIDGTGSGTFDEANRSGAFNLSMDFGSIPQVAQLLGGSTVQLQEILQGLTVYVKLPAALAHSAGLHGKPWVKIDLARAAQGLGIPGLSTLTNNPLSSDPSQYLRYLRATGSHVTQVGTETIDGRTTTGYRAQIQLDRVPNTLPAADRAQARQAIAAIEQMTHLHLLPVTVWIDGQHLVRRIDLSFNETVSGQPLTTSIQIDIPEYGPQQPPQPPPASQVTDLTGQLAGP